MLALPSARRCINLACLLIATIHAPSLAAPNSYPTVAVELSDGRQFTAAIDDRTDREQLWLRFDRPASLVLRPVSWSAITAATVSDQRLTVDQLMEKLPDLVSKRRLERPRSNNGSPAPQQLEQSPPPTVTSLDIHARIANWDADPEPDGLEVDLAPLDANGYLTPANATAEATLVGVTGIRRASPSGRARAIDDRFPILGRWTVIVRPEDFSSTGALVRLPFQAVDPHVAEEYRYVGAVTVRLVVPGNGVFTATDDAVLLRSTSPLRSRHESFYRTRTLPSERRSPIHPQITQISQSIKESSESGKRDCRASKICAICEICG